MLVEFHVQEAHDCVGIRRVCTWIACSLLTLPCCGHKASMCVWWFVCSAAWICSNTVCIHRLGKLVYTLNLVNEQYRWFEKIVLLFQKRWIKPRIKLTVEFGYIDYCSDFSKHKLSLGSSQFIYCIIKDSLKIKMDKAWTVHVDSGQPLIYVSNFFSYGTAHFMMVSRNLGLSCTFSP